MDYSLSLTADQSLALNQHLLPEDNKEAAGIIYCYPCRSDNAFKFIFHQFIPIPYRRSNIRTAHCIKWNFSDFFNGEEIEKLDKKGLSVLIIHSHPNGFNDFSETDNKNDTKLFPSINGWFDDNRPNGALILLSNAKLIGRVVDHKGNFFPIKKISIIGDSINIETSPKKKIVKDYSLRLKQTFGKGTLNTLRNLKVAVVGCSGTGSIVIELLARNCVGELLLVDKDIVEEKNLNRIINSKKEHAKNKAFKVDILKEAIENMGLETKVFVLKKATYEEGVLHKIKEYDVVFGCVDSAEGRLHLDIISCCYLIPYFDVGVRLEAKKEGKIDQAIAKVRYINPVGPYLIDMHGYTLEQTRAEDSKRNDPEHYNKNNIAGYLESVQEDQPAVISLNMQAACLSVNDFLARLHNYRLDHNSEYTEQSFSLTHGHYQQNNKKDITSFKFEKYLGEGDKSDLMLNK